MGRRPVEADHCPEGSDTVRFDAKDIARQAQEHGEDPDRAVIFQALGAASMAWSETPTGVFDDKWASEVGESVCNYFAAGAE
jgi:hypothetical protein